MPQYPGFFYSRQIADTLIITTKVENLWMYSWSVQMNCVHKLLVVLRKSAAKLRISPGHVECWWKPHHNSVIVSHTVWWCHMKTILCWPLRQNSWLLFWQTDTRYLNMQISICSSLWLFQQLNSPSSLDVIWTIRKC